MGFSLSQNSVSSRPWQNHEVPEHCRSTCDMMLSWGFARFLLITGGIRACQRGKNCFGNKSLSISRRGPLEVLRQGPPGCLKHKSFGLLGPRWTFESRFNTCRGMVLSKREREHLSIEADHAHLFKAAHYTPKAHFLWTISTPTQTAIVLHYLSFENVAYNIGYFQGA